MSTWEDWDQPVRCELPDPLVWLPAHAIAALIGMDLQENDRGEVVAVGDFVWMWTGEWELKRDKRARDGWRLVESPGEFVCKFEWTADEFSEWLEGPLDLHLAIGWARERDPASVCRWKGPIGKHGPLALNDDAARGDQLRMF